VGLHSAFTSVFPIVELFGQCRARVRELRARRAAFDVKECQLRGLTYAAPLRVTVRLVIHEKEAPAGSAT
jgi:DNA-directed RNA polymerase subunit beta